jgi:hypothetical protein
MIEAWLAEPKLFKGPFSLGSESVAAEIRVGIDETGELTFDFTPIAFSARSLFIMIAWHGDKSDIAHFLFHGVSLIAPRIWRGTMT